MSQVKTFNKPFNKKQKRIIEGNKEERSQKARDWLKFLKDKYPEEFEKAKNNTTTHRDIYPDCFDIPDRRYERTTTRIFNNDVVTCAKAAVTHAEKGAKVLVLNFASFVNPGGGFMKGSTAQEEAICHSTGLYPCLSSNMEFYQENRQMDTDSCYTNDYIYSEDVPFIVNGKCYFVDVLTMAAPNNVKSKNSPVKDIFEERMECAFLIGIEKKIDVILLGAWGCGVFGNDPQFVAETWRDLTREYSGYYKEVVHPVLDKDMFKTFKDVMYK